MKLKGISQEGMKRPARKVAYSVAFRDAQQYWNEINDIAYAVNDEYDDTGDQGKRLDALIRAKVEKSEYYTTEKGLFIASDVSPNMPEGLDQYDESYESEVSQAMHADVMSHLLSIWEEEGDSWGDDEDEEL